MQTLSFEETGIIHAAQALLRRWLEYEEDITSYLQNPNYEKIIIEATAQLGTLSQSEMWIELVRGDGQDQRRIALAEQCLERLTRKNNSFSKKG